MASNAPTCATMNDLPNELLILIFEYLEIRHLIQCSLVCKRFKLLCQDVRVPELIISNTNNNFKTHWFFTNKQLNYQNAISVTAFNSYRSTFRVDKFRRLHFHGNASEYAQLELNEFTQLKQVAINFYGPDDVRHEFHIDLPNLIILQIFSMFDRHQFYITTPKLEILKYDEFDSIDLTYVDNIKHLETGFYAESLHLLNEAEIPLIKHIRDLKLTTLSCNSGYVIEALENLIRDKRDHRRYLTKIYFLSVEIDDVTKIAEYKNHRDDFLFQINNYNALAETVSNDALLHVRVNYNQLMNTMKGKIPEDFFKKFSSTTKVRVNGKVEDPKHLYWFLKKFDYLQELSLRSDSLDQTFYSQLGELDQLTSLIVADSSLPLWRRSKLSFNFDFILKLKLLNHFRTNFMSSNYFDLTLELFTHSTNFKWIHFYFHERMVFILRATSNAYELFYDACEKLELDFNELVREVDAIRSRHNDQD